MVSDEDKELGLGAASCSIAGVRVSGMWICIVVGTRMCNGSVLKEIHGGMREGE